MARAIYKIELKQCYFPALSQAEAVELRNRSASCGEDIQDEEVNVNIVVQEEHTMRLFRLAKLLMDMEEYTAPEIDAIICALARQLGYEDTCKEVADCVIHWVEKVAEDMTLSEMEEWVIG